MTADLTNDSGLELTAVWDWLGAKRYVSNLFIPNTDETEWDLEDCVQAYVDVLMGGEMEACMHFSCVLESVKGRVRGRIDAGRTHTVAVSVPGALGGAATPSWMVMGLRQIPDNANRLVVVPGTSVFQQGRISLPGVAATVLNGNNVTGTALGLYEDFADVIGSIPAGVDTARNPGFSLCMTRVVAGALKAKANVTAIQVGELGTQLTARH